MDILRFVNSKAIRNHLADIHYQFDSLEAAWLIYQCRDATIKEKHKAWTELIKTMPDCPIPERRNTVPQESLHAFLRKYMDLEDRCVREFYEDHHGDSYGEPKPCVYRFRDVYDDGSSDDWDAVFSRFDAVYETNPEPDDDVVEIECIKNRIDQPDPVARVRLTPNFELLSLDSGIVEKKEESDVFYGVFEGLWFDFPTPFKKGDIVWDPYTPIGYKEGAFVIDEINIACYSDRIKEHIRKDGDTTDMIARGFFLTEEGIYHDVMIQYMDLEYYEEELKDFNRVLIPLSNYLKGKIDESIYARAYHQILSESWANTCRPRDITKEGMILAGLEREEQTSDAKTEE